MRAIEAVSTRQKRWTDLIRQQGQSKLSITAFCREHQISDQSFYNWRKRLSGSEPVRFVLVEAGAQFTKDNAPIAVVLASGDRLRVAPGADAATLRTAYRIHAPHFIEASPSHHWGMSQRYSRGLGSL